MEKQIKIKSEYNSLEKILAFLQKESPYESSIDYDAWDVRTDANGQMEKCVLIKKGSMHGMKLYFSQKNTLQISYLIPNKLMNAYFGKNQKARQNILEILTGVIKNLVLSGSQKDAFEDIGQVFNKIAL